MEGANKRWRGITLELQQAAWRLRTGTTPAETLLWEALRGGQLNGLRFRRQHPAGQFILDFYCSRHKLVVELDGGIHEAQADQDAARTAQLNSFGYRVLRFQNEELFADLPSVLDRIAAATSDGPSGSPIIGG